MAQEQAPPSGPDLTKGVGPGDFVDDKLLGHVGDEEVLLVRRGGEIFAVGAHCTHYHGPLAEGLVVGDTRALSLASRLLRSAHRRSGSARRRSARSPAGRSSSATASIFVTQEARAAEAARHGGEARMRPNKIVDRRRRRGRLRGGRNAAAARVTAAASSC